MKKKCNHNKCELIIYILGFVLLGVIVAWTVTANIHERYAGSYDDTVMLPKIKEALVKLDPKAAKITLKGNNKSFTLNKKETHLCLKDKSGEYYDYNTIMYVAIHELAHVLCSSIGHTEEWQGIFDVLLDRAHNMGIYDKNIPMQKNYCGYN